MNYQHITENERYQICALRKAEHTISDIARLMNRHKSTISRELRRNCGSRAYRPQQANRLAVERRHVASGRARIDSSVWAYVESGLRQDWSPEQISGWLLINALGCVSHERIYQHIYHDKAQGGDLHRHLRCQKLRRKRYGAGYSRRGQLIGRVGIEQRPLYVDRRERIGDWEGDTLIGRHHRGAVVSLVERKSQLTRLALLPDRKADRVKCAIVKCLRPLARQVHTLTLDNGKEFAEHQQITRQLQMPIYFADPYAAWQRGLNEQINGLIRQYIPKSADLSTLTWRDIRHIENRLNNRPRKSLGFKTPNEIFFGH